MNEFVTNLAQRAGIDDNAAQKGLGALLSTIQRNVPADTFTKLSTAIPDTGGILSSFQKVAKPSSDGGGLLDLAGGLLGKDAGALGTLISQFSKAGFTVESAKSFIPIALNLLKDKISPDLMKQIDTALPGVSNLLAGEKTVSTKPIDAFKKLF